MGKPTQKNDVPNIQHNNRLPTNLRKNFRRQRRKNRLDILPRRSKEKTREGTPNMERRKMKPCEIQFVNEKIQKTYEELKEKPLKDQLEKALCDIKENPFCGIQIPKRLIPKEYIKKHNIANVWKYNLPGAWRLIYSIRGGDAITPIY